MKPIPFTMGLARRGLPYIPGQPATRDVSETGERR